VGGLNASTDSAFKREAHYGIVVKPYVSMTDTTNAASGVEAQIERLSQTTYHSSSSSSRKPSYRVTAVLKYLLVDIHNVTCYKNCSMTMGPYYHRSSATTGMTKVPVGQHMDVHVSVRHHGRYCISTRRLMHYHKMGVDSLYALGACIALVVVCMYAMQCINKYCPATVTPIDEGDPEAPPARNADKASGCFYTTGVYHVGRYWVPGQGQTRTGGGNGGGGGNSLPAFYHQPHRHIGSHMASAAFYAPVGKQMRLR
jgi:hypothetical protein